MADGEFKSTAYFCGSPDAIVLSARHVKSWPMEATRLAGALGSLLETSQPLSLLCLGRELLLSDPDTDESSFWRLQTQLGCLTSARKVAWAREQY